MSNKSDAFGNDRYKVRVPYKASVSRFGETDLKNLKSAKAELGGFAGREISNFMAVLGISEEEFGPMVDHLKNPSQLDRLPQKDLCSLLVLFSLVCAALGDEELATITGSGRDEHFLTIRRIYHAFARRSVGQD